MKSKNAKLVRKQYKAAKNALEFIKLIQGKSGIDCTLNQNFSEQTDSKVEVAYWGSLADRSESL